jgi:pimeloyl-ACP methyl ester carboxylesterase
MDYEAASIFLKKIPSRKPSEQKPLVALHGWGRDHQSLMTLAQLLSESRDVYLLDIPGFGQSPIPEMNSFIPSSFDIARWVLKRLDQENIQVFDLLGHSFGGKVAFSMASENSLRVHRLILMAASGMKTRHPWKKWARLKALRLAAKLLKIVDHFFHSHFFKNWFSPKFGSKDYLSSQKMRPVLVRSIQEDLEGVLKTISTPTLLLWGEKDEDTPFEIALRMQKALPKAQLRSLPLASHQLMDDSPSLCAYFIESFLMSEAP